MSERETYRTVAGRGEAAFEIRGSEFIGHVRPANTVEDAEAFVDEMNEAYDDATHNVPAYRVRVESGGPGGGYLLREYESDDGEPSGSSGKPALNVLQQRDVQNVVAVVTRYYGGTKLGVGGLARAYSRGVKEAVDDADVVEVRPQATFDVTVDYDDSGTVRGILESADCEVEAEYGERVSFAVTTDVDAAADLRDRLRSATSGRVEIEE
ncbi:IMPACT family protein [Halospeciosus flavus]|uniref:IMPACT family protein n=1 Tax=Halospeciosus flavus TaxID=3032283 RepID=A0ABD5Z7B1_9EURY|nr:YigZ family protein [Halospeciosus flavus]